MNRFQISLRTKVVLSLTFLMASAMLLIGMVMLKVSQRDLLRAKVEQGFVLKTAVERLLVGSSEGKIDLAKSGSLLVDLQAGNLEHHQYVYGYPRGGCQMPQDDPAVYLP